MTKRISLIKHFEQLREADKEAIRTALDAAKEKSKSHNDILGAMREQQATFVTKESVKWATMALIAGIAVAVSIFAAINA